MISACRAYRAPQVKSHSNLLSTKCKVMFLVHFWGEELKRKGGNGERKKEEEKKRKKERERDREREKFIIIVLFNSTYVFK